MLVSILTWVMTMKLRYSEAMMRDSFSERYAYLRLGNGIFQETFGDDRYLNQMLYKSDRWKKVRREVIIRDDGCDLGFRDRPIKDAIYVHHINPVTKEDILEGREIVFDPENLICCSYSTHYAIHYGRYEDTSYVYTERRPNDQAPWKE